jgi:hypothetical protein
LVLRVPDTAGLSVRGFEVHRVAVGDISCDDDDACGGDHGDGGCGEDDGCDHGGEALTAVPSIEHPVQAAVSGVAVVHNAGDTGMPAGTKVQVKFVLTDAGSDLNSDQVDVQINTFVPGPSKPLLYQSGPVTIQQAQIHTLGS